MKAVFLNSAASGGFLSHWSVDTPVLAFVHELPKLLASLDREFRLILDRANTIIAGSEAVATAIKGDYGFEPERLRTVHGFIDDLPRDTSLDFDSKSAIKEALVKKFSDLDANRFSVAGMGWSRPADADDAHNHAKNRRVEIKIFTAEKE